MQVHKKYRQTASHSAETTTSQMRNSRKPTNHLPHRSNFSGRQQRRPAPRRHRILRLGSAYIHRLHSPKFPRSGIFRFILYVPGRQTNLPELAGAQNIVTWQIWGTCIDPIHPSLGEHVEGRRNRRARMKEGTFLGSTGTRCGAAGARRTRFAIQAERARRVGLSPTLTSHLLRNKWDLAGAGRQGTCL